MEYTISVGQLRQNPTAMIREVKQGAVYTLTDRGQPVADITPHRSPRWQAGRDVAALLAQLGPDPTWSEEVAQLRAAEPLRDPWDDRA